MPFDAYKKVFHPFHYDDTQPAVQQDGTMGEDSSMQPKLSVEEVCCSWCTVNGGSRMDTAKVLGILVEGNNKTQPGQIRSFLGTFPRIRN